MASPPPSPPLSPTPPPLTYHFEDKTPEHGWVKAVMVDLYKAALKENTGRGVPFNAQVAERALRKIVRESIPMVYSGGKPQEPEVEKVTNRLALLAINARDGRLSTQELFEEIEALPPPLRDKLLALPGVRDDPRKLILFKNESGTPLLEALIKTPDLAALEGTFSLREARPTEAINFPELERQVLKLLKPVLASDASSVPAVIDMVYPDSEADRLQLAKLVAASDPRKVACSISVYGITSEDDRLSVAEIIAPLDGKALIDSLGMWKIEDPGKRLRLAILIAKENPTLPCSDLQPPYLWDYFLQKHPDLIDLVRIFVDSGRLEGLGPYLFLLSPEERLDCLDRVAEKFPSQAMKFVCSWVTEPQARLELAYRAAEKNPYVLYTLPPLLDQFDLEEGAVSERAALAKRIAEAPPLPQSEDERKKLGFNFPPYWARLFLNQFAISDPKELIEITRRLSLHNPNEITLSYVIKVLKAGNFSRSPEDSLALAKILAEASPHLLLQTLPGFTLKNDADRLFLAKKIASAKELTDEEVKAKGFSTRPCVVELLLERLPFKEEGDRILIAKCLATVERQGYGDSLAAHILDFDIEQKEALFEIAKLEARGNPQGMGMGWDRIKNYLLTASERLEVAEIMARTSFSALCQCIKQLNLPDPEDRFRLAMLGLEHGLPCPLPKDFKVFLDGFNLWHHPQILEVMKKAVHQGVGFPSRYNRGYEFTSIPEEVGTQKERAVLAAQLILLQGHEPNIGSAWGVKDRGIRDALFLVHNAHHRSWTSLSRDKSVLDYLQECTSYFNPGWLEGWLKETQQSLKGASGEEEGRLRNLADAKIALIVKIGVWLRVHEVPLPLSKIVKQTLTQIVEYGNSTLGEQLLTLFCNEVLPDPAKRAVFESNSSTQFMQLPMIFAAALGMRGEDLKSFASFLHAGRSSLRNGSKPDKQMLLNALSGTMKNPHLNGEEKAQVIGLLSFSSKPTAEKRYSECLERFITLQTYLGFTSEPNLKKLPEEGLNEELQRRLIICIKEVGGLDFTGIEDFTSKYKKTFGSTRVPGAFFFYASRLPKDPPLQEAVARFGKSVLKGDEAFKRERYDTARSSHLEFIAASHPEVWRKWQAGAPPKPALVVPTASHSRLDFHPFFREKLGHNHDKGTFTQLRAYLLEPTEAKLRQCREALTLPQEGRDPKSRKAEKLCLDLLENPTNIALLTQIEEAMPPDLELLNDIRGEQTLLRERLNPQGLKVVDQDDWQALLLAGTEVPGSCQRIDGYPHLNQCLLAYILDGKNRLIAVVEPSGKLVGRAVFRLLLDASSSPVLFLETLYSRAPETNAAITSFAKERAEELGLPLFTAGDSTRGDTTRLRSLGSSAPYEYVDANRLGITRGSFTVVAKPL